MSTQYRWALLDDWLGEPLEAIPPRRASAELAQAWLRSYGPGTITDLRWWTGWTVRKTEMALADAGAVEVELADCLGFVLPEDVDEVTAPVGWVALLPGLDSTSMGWKERAWYFGDHVPRLFDHNGNAGPTVWFDGSVVGGWSQRARGEVVFRLLQDVGENAERAIEHEAAALQRWVGDLRVTPRFRTPLERELSDP
jgi:DNA glycosylase AlkZ-like